LIIKLNIEGEFADEELRSLHAWLIDEPDVHHNARIEFATASPGERDMGTTLDMIALAVTGTLQLPTFAQVLADWWRTRRRKYPVTIEVDGMTVILTDADEDFVLKVIRELKVDD
jgi:hypothetical protein